MPDFSTAQVGDRVWSYRFGAGQISKVDQSCVQVCFDRDNLGQVPVNYELDGKRFYDNAAPELHWDKPQIVEPPPPNRYVCEHGWVDCIDRETKKHFRRCFFCHEVEKPVALTREQIVQLMNTLGELLERKDMGNG